MEDNFCVYENAELNERKVDFVDWKRIYTSSLLSVIIRVRTKPKTARIRLRCQKYHIGNFSVVSTEKPFTNHVWFSWPFEFAFEWA